ncbi:MAG: GIY-YIG nuclease family protein [Microcoleus sp. SM1_3_4]|nr:GIY-YIG nuclease family protein [Microcoleus sp. SM1_3_4]
MAWSQWIECNFDSKGELNTQAVGRAPNSSGVYAIATKTGSNYHTHYVGRSGRSIRGRLQSHFTGKGNKVIAGLLKNKKERPSDPTQALYFAYLETKEHKLIEAAYIDAKAEDRPLANLIKAKLPQGLREQDVFGSQLEN